MRHCTHPLLQRERAITFARMRIARFISGSKIRIGQLVDDTSARRIEGHPLGVHEVTDEVLKIDKLLAPLVPTDILCIALNYRGNAAESNAPIPANPMLFITGSNTLNNPFDPIPIPKRSSMIDYEAELCIVIGKDAKHVSRDDALEYVYGYTCANDVS